MNESPDLLSGPGCEGHLIKESQIMTQMLKIDPPWQIMVAPKSNLLRWSSTKQRTAQSEVRKCKLYCKFVLLSSLIFRRERHL